MYDIDEISGQGIFTTRGGTRRLFVSNVDGEISQGQGYFYSHFRFPQNVEWTLGLSYDDYHQGDLQEQKINPKAGMRWSITDDLQFRAAAFRTVKPALLSNQTIQPTQISGFNQFFDDGNGWISTTYGLGVDARLFDGVYAGMEGSKRDLDQPSTDRSAAKILDRDEMLYSGYLYWTPHPDWAASAQIRYDLFDRGSKGFSPTQVETLSAPISLRYFNPSGLFAGGAATYVRQDVSTGNPQQWEGNSAFVVFDVAIGYRFPQRRGLIGLEIRNLLNNDFKYQDDNFRRVQREPAISWFIPERTILGQLTLQF